ncbi:MAG: DUF998 domain-containing protein [Gemmatimonadales bacterium]
MARKLLLTCGILSSLLYVAMNVFVAMQWADYSSSSQTVSELSAIGAPTRPLWVVLGFAYTVLVTAFGWGVLASGRDDRRLRVTGRLLIAYGLTGLVWPFAPMHQRAVLVTGGGTISDTMHIALSMVTVLLMLLAIGFGAAAFGRWFRLYSIVTLLLLLAFGVLVYLESPGIPADLPTPMIGIWERLDIGLFLVWVVVLAAALLQAQVERPRDGLGTRPA